MECVVFRSTMEFLVCRMKMECLVFRSTMECLVFRSTMECLVCQMKMECVVFRSTMECLVSRMKKKCVVFRSKDNTYSVCRKTIDLCISKTMKDDNWMRVWKECRYKVWYAWWYIGRLCHIKHCFPEFSLILYNSIRMAAKWCNFIIRNYIIFLSWNQNYSYVSVYQKKSKLFFKWEKGSENIKIFSGQNYHSDSKWKLYVVTSLSFSVV